jgi:pimeloyl-ACP methyl ester carboxylesterase
VTTIAAQGRFISVKDELIHLVEAGSGPPTVLLHGFPGSAFSWQAVQGLLAGKLRTLAVDAVGFGHSTRSPRRPLDGDAYADRVADLLAALGLERAHLVGVSWGGGVAQRVAVRHPDRVDRLVLVAAVDAGHRLRLGLPDLVPLRLAAHAPALARRMVGRFLARRSRSAGLTTAELGRGYVDPLLVPGTGAFLARFVEATRETPAIDVGRIRAPTLVISPLGDRIVLPEVEASLARRIPGARLAAIAGASHSVPHEQPGAVADLITGFLLAADPAD